MFHTFFWSLSFSLSLSHGETWIPMEDLLFFLRLKEAQMGSSCKKQLLVTIVLCLPWCGPILSSSFFFVFSGNNYGTVDSDLGSEYLGCRGVKICVCVCFVS
jgi:hypothetical protein